MLKAGERAPEVEFLSYPDQEWIALRELFEEGPVGLIFAKQSCPTCQWGFPFLDRLGGDHSGLPPGRVFFVLQEDAETAAELVNQYQLKTPILLDPEPFTAGEAFELSFVPDGVLILPSGKIEVSFESFDRPALEQISSYLEAEFELDSVQLFGADEGIPAFRPG